MSRRRIAAVTAATALVGVSFAVAPQAGAATSTPLVIGVDSVDAPNQQPFPPFNRLFEYTDFFARSITVHQGDTIDFQTQPGSFHIVALAASEAAARQAYPVIALDNQDTTAPGTGLPKLILADGNFPVTGGSSHGGGTVSHQDVKGPPVCGAVQFNEAPCTFAGGNDVEIIGPTVGWNIQQQPITVDQNVVINAPVGTYAYFDMTHPGMRGTLTVVPANQPTSTQAYIDAQSARQVQQDRAQALSVEATLNQAGNVLGTPGHRTFFVAVGTGAASDHVGIDEFLPNRPIDAVPGDRVVFVWPDDHAMHTVGFATSPWVLPPAFGYDCGGSGYLGIPNLFDTPPPAPCFKPGSTTAEFIGDPGNAGPGTALGALGDITDAGLLVGRGFGASPTRQCWSVTITADTAKGAHTFFDVLHPWMTGVINVS